MAAYYMEQQENYILNRSTPFTVRAFNYAIMELFDHPLQKEANEPSLYIRRTQYYNTLPTFVELFLIVLLKPLIISNVIYGKF